MRVGLGNNPGSCAAGADPTTYMCFDDTGTGTNGLVALRSYAATTGNQMNPVLQAVTPTAACSGTPFFSDFQTTTGSLMLASLPR